MTTSLLSKTVTTTAGVTHIDLAFSAAMAKGRGTIFVTDGAVQTVIDRVNGEPKLRVVGATVTREISLDAVTITGSHVSFDATGLAAGKHYNIYMGAGTLTSGGASFAGYTVPNQVAFDVAAAPAPGLSASFAVEEAILRSGHDLTVFVTLSQAVATLAPNAFSAENASVLSVTRTENPLQWKVVLTRSGPVADAENVLRLDLTKVETAPGVHGSGVATSPSYAVDTLVGAWVSGAGVTWDTGASDEDNVINHAAPALTGTLSGALGGSETIEVLVNGKAVDPARITVSQADGLWTWSYVPGEGDDAPVLDEGNNAVVVRVVDAGHHSSAGHVATIVVDTVRPEFETSPEGDAALPLSQDIVITFKEKMYWIDWESSTMPIKVTNLDDETIDHVSVSAAAFIDGGGTLLTLDPGALGLEPGKRYEITLPDNLTDLAGNRLADTTIAFRTGADNGAPSATHALVDGNLFYKAGDTIAFRIQFSEAIRITSDAVLSVGLSNDQRAIVSYVSDKEIGFEYVVAAGAGVDTDDLTITDTALLTANIEDFDANALDAAHIIFDGIEQYQYTGYGYGYLPVDIVVDTVAPNAPAAPALATSSDSGILGDHLTNERMPTLTGTAEARTWVGIYEGSTYLGGARADAAGHWSAAVDAELAHGLHNLTIKQTDRAGNDSAGTAYALTIDLEVASLAAPLLANDTGSSAADRITRDATLKGSGAEANALIQIMRDGVVVGGGSADAGGNWSVALGGNPADGSHTYTVRQVDVAGNVSADSPPLTFTLDRSAPGAPVGTPDLAAASDSGVSNTDNITSVRTPTFNGGGALADSGVALFADGVEIVRTTADAAGNWSATVPGAKALADGVHAITVRQFDLAGNMSGDSGALSITVDNVGPSAGTASISLAGGARFVLPFSEAIVFQPGGSFNLFQGGAQRDSFWGNSSSGWSIGADSHGDLSVLNFNISLSGLLRMQWNNGSVTDLAGNAAIVGLGIWDFEL
ncbi:Ig-like domain-containing protein [uncultured Massilia sp.]|uniref:Ig-like domain-containing protein n=1 Tax=uncultured Massilia sp. TaxID=169973 RepID=UPI002583B756|nr:Ig-like domain-containing protein [uncultured Massilia sp.]